MTCPEHRLADLGIELPRPPTPRASYVPVVQAGSLWFVSGQVATHEGSLVAAGLLGDGLDVAEGVRCARQCAINVLAQIKAVLGELRRVERVVKLGVFVASAPGFAEQHLVANGASELLADVLGEAGTHARSAIGVAGLPTGSPVEVEAIIQATP